MEKKNQNSSVLYSEQHASRTHGYHDTQLNHGYWLIQPSRPLFPLFFPFLAFYLLASSPTTHTHTQRERGGGMKESHQLMVPLSRHRASRGLDCRKQQ